MRQNHFMQSAAKIGNVMAQQTELLLISSGCCLHWRRGSDLSEEGKSVEIGLSGSEVDLLDFCSIPYITYTL
jgi:hypothetical protein